MQLSFCPLGLLLIRPDMGHPPPITSIADPSEPNQTRAPEREGEMCITQDCASVQVGLVRSDVLLPSGSAEVDNPT